MKYTFRGFLTNHPGTRVYAIGLAQRIAFGPQNLRDNKNRIFLIESIKSPIYTNLFIAAK